MTDQPSIQAKIWRGYAQAARKLGYCYQFTRPASTYPGDLLFDAFVSLNAEDMKYSKPRGYAKATWYALTDGTFLQVGDYFTGQQGVFFIAAMQPLLPILTVQCNRTATLARVPELGIGAQSYGGMTNEVAYAAGFPCSILQGTKGEKADASLPGDTRLPWWTILMPASVGNVAYGDKLTDDLGRFYFISSAELTGLGYRITAALTQT